MNRKRKISIAVFGIVLVLVAVTVVTASPRILPNTPLYAVRMEQASNEMNFSPMEDGGFTYSAESNSELSFEFAGFCTQAEPPEPTPVPNTCQGCESVNYTCQWDTCFQTCANTCESTCLYSCADTCVYTCDTCVETCWNTCVYTCKTCVYTCNNTCMETCGETCGETCYQTCWITCGETCWTCQ